MRPNINNCIYFFMHALWFILKVASCHCHINCKNTTLFFNAFSAVNVCSGDSGGPLMYRTKPDEPWFLIGIVSFGTQDCTIKKPSVYTDVVKYMDWIEKNIKP